MSVCEIMSVCSNLFRTRVVHPRAPVVLPGTLLSLSGLGDTYVDPSGRYIWMRVMALITACLGFYYWQAACANNREFFTASVYGRVAFFLGALSMRFLYDAPWMVVGFGAFDALAAAGLHVILRGEAKQQRKQRQSR